MARMSMSPGLAAMNDRAAAAVPFAQAAQIGQLCADSRRFCHTPTATQIN
jgi:hypothetical protein